MKVVTTFLTTKLDAEKHPVQDILTEIDDKASEAVAAVLKKHGIKGELLSATNAGEDNIRVVVVGGDKIVGIRKHNELIRGIREQETVNKHWASLLPSQDLHHPDDPHYQ